MLTDRPTPWEADIQADYSTMSPRRLTSEIADLTVELRNARHFDPIAKAVVDLLVGARLDVARTELKQRIADGSA